MSLLESNKIVLEFLKRVKKAWLVINYLMVTAYLLMNTRSGTEQTIAQAFNKKKEVKDITIVYGVYDIVIKIEVKTMAELESFILGLRKDYKDIEQTSTLICTSGN